MSIAKEIKSLGLPRYNWWSEASSGVQSARNTQTTKFPFPITTGPVQHAFFPWGQRFGMVWLSVDSVGGYTYCTYRTNLRWEKDPNRNWLGRTDRKSSVNSAFCSSKQARNELQPKPLEACWPSNWSGSSCCHEYWKRFLHILGASYQSCKRSLATTYNIL